MAPMRNNYESTQDTRVHRLTGICAWPRGSANPRCWPRERPMIADLRVLFLAARCFSGRRQRDQLSDQLALKIPQDIPFQLDLIFMSKLISDHHFKKSSQLYTEMEIYDNSRKSSQFVHRVIEMELYDSIILGCASQCLTPQHAPCFVGAILLFFLFQWRDQGYPH